jgi:DNA (cytosine-5)-methyltransferase 1
VTAGVPCQSWSIAGRNLGFDDDRGQLWNDAIFLLKNSRPRTFIFENVKGLADPRNASALRHIHERIRDAGYFAKHYVLNSFDYGVPQARVRIYIVGFREERFFSAFAPPAPVGKKTRLRDVMEGEVEDCPAPSLGRGARTGGRPLRHPTSLSANNNGHNDYFIFNDIRDGPTAIHSWDILPTTERQKNICLLLLKNRRKRPYGPLDGNPLSLGHLQALDASISRRELDELCGMGVLKEERYSFALECPAPSGAVPLDENESLLYSKAEAGMVVPDRLVCDPDAKRARVPVTATLASLEKKGLARCVETRYELRHTKISGGLGGVCRVFLPTSNIFSTLVASDTNDRLTPVSIAAAGAEDYKREFLERVYAPRRFRKISKVEACRMQGFPDGFILPDARPAWMKLLGNSVSVPLVRALARAVADTGVFA